MTHVDERPPQTEDDELALALALSLSENGTDTPASTRQLTSSMVDHSTAIDEEVELALALSRSLSESNVITPTVSLPDTSRSVIIERTAGEKIGMSIESAGSSHPVFVSSVARGGAVDRTRAIFKGDRVIEINSIVCIV